MTHLALFEFLYKQAVFVRVDMKNLQYDNRCAVTDTNYKLLSPSQYRVGQKTGLFFDSL